MPLQRQVIIAKTNPEVLDFFYKNKYYDDKYTSLTFNKYYIKHFSENPDIKKDKLIIIDIILMLFIVLIIIKHAIN